jgi:hypothetical protein
MSEKEYRKYCWKQISLPVRTSEKLQTISDNFRYGKKLKRGKIIEAMSWQYNLIKNNNYAIVFRDGKFEVIENATR